MGVPGGPEASIDALVRVLRANLYTYLEQEWTLANDAAACPKPYPHASEAWSWSSNGANVSEFLKPQAEYPVVWVRPYQGQMGNNAAPVWGDFSHQMVVQSRIQGDRIDVAARQALRFTWAIVRCIQKNLPSLGSTIDGSVGFTPQHYTITPENAGDLVMVSELTVTSSVEESF